MIHVTIYLLSICFFYNVYGQTECNLNYNRIFATFGKRECSNYENTYENFCINIRVNKHSSIACVVPTICNKYAIDFQIKRKHEENSIACKDNELFIHVRSSLEYRISSCSKNTTDDDFLLVYITTSNFTEATGHFTTTVKPEATGSKCVELFGKCHKIPKLFIMSGIILGTLVLIIFIIAVGCYCRIKNKRRREWERQILSNTPKKSYAFEEYMGTDSLPTRIERSNGHTQRVSISDSSRESDEHDYQIHEEQEPYENHTLTKSIDTQSEISSSRNETSDDENSEHAYENHTR